MIYADHTVFTIAWKTEEQLIADTDEAFTVTKDYCAPINLVLNEQKIVQLVFHTIQYNHKIVFSTKTKVVWINQDWE